MLLIMKSVSILMAVVFIFACFGPDPVEAGTTPPPDQMDSLSTSPLEVQTSNPADFSISANNISDRLPEQPLSTLPFTAAAALTSCSVLVSNAVQPDYSSQDVDDLIDNCTYPADTDSDNLPDSVENVLGTDPSFADSDFDELDDYFEVHNNLDPMAPDSNNDGLADYLEITDVPLDIDGDGTPNAWDPDNDDDGVPDSLDTSPFTRTPVQSAFTFKVTSSGNPLYLDFQVRPADSEHLKLFLQNWNWQDEDASGIMQDLDSSRNDITIIPMLELAADILPEQEDIVEYGIVLAGDMAYIPLSPVWDDSRLVAFQGRMFYPSSISLSDTSLQISMFWIVKGQSDQYHRLTNQNSELFLGVENAGTAVDDYVVQQEDDLVTSRQWLLEADGDWYRVINRHSGLFLDVKDASTAAEAHIFQDEDESVIPDSELWTLDKTGNECRIINKKSNYYLDIAAGSTQSGALVVQDEYEDSDNQIWLLSPLIGEKNCYLLVNKNSGLYLDVKDAGTEVGDAVIRTVLTPVTLRSGFCSPGETITSSSTVKAICAWGWKTAVC